MQKYYEILSKFWNGIHSNMHTYEKVIQRDTPKGATIACFHFRVNFFFYECKWGHYNRQPTRD